MYKYGMPVSILYRRETGIRSHRGAYRFMRHSLLRSYAERHAEIGVLLFRLFLGAVLAYGTQDNIFSNAHMLEFRDFLEQHGFPYPLFCAYLSAYAQFVAGLLIFVGAFTRVASLVMVVNFLVALGMVHVGLPFSANIAPLAMFFGSVLFLFHGGGIGSVDAMRETRASRRSGGRASS